MTPAARLSAAIEILDAIAAGRGAADATIRAWGKAHRFAGSTDRRLIGERVYGVLRGRARLSWAMGEEGGRALVLGALGLGDAGELAACPVDQIEALFSGEGHAPAPLSDAERGQLARAAEVVARETPPAWVEAGLPPFVVANLEAQFRGKATAEAQALIRARAPLDLRVNSLRGEVAQAISLLRTDAVEPVATPFSSLGLRLAPELATDVQRLRAFASGWVEVQDEASQIAAALAGAAPGMAVVDYCAGGGGKTLALGASLRRSGRLVACDVSARRLSAMGIRLGRSDVTAEVRRIGPEGEGAQDLEQIADLVFVDAPCSGSGTWRRHPEGAWRLTPEAVERLASLQAKILANAARLVRPGGRLAYATCSVLDSENALVAAAFCAAHPQFCPVRIVSAACTPILTDAARGRFAELCGDGHQLQMTPRRTGTDGFFIALFERRPERIP